MILEAQHICKSYDGGKKVALQDFSLSMPKGSIYGLLGPNGAGKTTFIRIINQIMMADSGEVWIDGKKLQPEHIKNIGYMPEERGLYKNMSVGDQIVYLAALKGMPASEAKAEAKVWFEKLSMEQWWNKKLAELSKGMAQKIQFVVTVIHRPSLLILDEPFSGFDPVNANLIRDQILELKKNGTSIILSTHRMESVEEMCDYVALIHQSKKIIDGKVYDVRQAHKDNSYRVQLTGVQADALQQFLFNHTGTAHTTTEYYDELRIPFSGEQSQLLQELSSLGTIIHFSENIPGMNEVFINAVQRQSLS